MITREQIETILRINGAEPLAPDEKIRSILLSAKFNEDEVDAALMILKENTKTNVSSVQSMHKVFNSDKPLTPTEVSQLLNYDMAIDEIPKQRERIRSLSHIQFLLIILVALVCGLSAVTFIMYVSKVGLFHPSMTG